MNAVKRFWCEVCKMTTLFNHVRSPFSLYPTYVCTKCNKWSVMDEDE